MLGYKSAGNYIINLELCEDSLHNLNRDNVIHRDYAPFRCNKTKVKCIRHKNTRKLIKKICSDIDPFFYYVSGKIIEENKYDESQENTCNSGIHLFRSKECAYYYKLLHYNPRYTGIYKEWHNNGNINVKCSYLNGKLDGIFNEWNESGIQTIECEFKSGSFEGFYKEFHANKNIKIICQYKNDMKNGKYQEFYENGKIKIDCEYLNNAINGQYNEYYDDGTNKKQSICIFGHEYGDIYVWDENGEQLVMCGC